jgi:hypothetical protein
MEGQRSEFALPLTALAMAQESWGVLDASNVAFHMDQFTRTSYMRIIVVLFLLIFINASSVVGQSFPPEHEYRALILSAKKKKAIILKSKNLKK